jgi:hypothetical protein
MKQSQKSALFVLLTLFLSLVTSPDSSTAAYTFTNFTFTSCGVTGQTGPSQAQCRTAYSTTWDESDANFTVASGIQKWTVPATGNYRITTVGAGGASGASGSGGKGVSLSGTFLLTEGEFIYLLVGQKGTYVSYVAGGGGGSFVYRNVNDAFPLIAAGGGGGGGSFDTSSGSQNGMDAETGTAGSNGNAMPNGKGTGGNGGTTATTSYYALGGAGWLSNGNLSNRSCTNNGVAALAPRNGGTGGNSNQAGTFGGFGGGGAPAMRCGAIGGGGGGGFSGGGPGGEAVAGNYSGGGGGGSYNSGSSPVVNGVTNTNDGSVTITLLAPTVSNFNSFTTAGNSTTSVFRSSLTITANLDVPSRVTFRVNGAKIPGCVNVQTSGTSPNIVATCTWRASVRGEVTLTASAIPTSGGSVGNTQNAIRIKVANRSGNR